MDDAQQSASEGAADAPTDCPHCGTPLESAAVDRLLPSEAELADHNTAAVVFQDFCPNPACPAKTVDPH